MPHLLRIGSVKTKTRIIATGRIQILFYRLTALEEAQGNFPHYFYITEHNQTLRFLVDITNVKKHIVSSNGIILSYWVFENMVLRRIFGPRRNEVTGEWRRLHNES